MSRDYLARKFEMHAEISTYSTDRQGNKLPIGVRFYLIDRWIDVPGEIVKVQQDRRDAPTLYTHTIFGPQQDAPLYADKDAAVVAAVKAYLQLGVNALIKEDA